MFDKLKFDTIEPFDWKELDGKTLKIKVCEDTDGDITATIVIAHEVNTDNCYFLAGEFKKVKE